MYPTKAERRERAQKKALSRFFAGASFEKLLLVTLTTPESFQGDLHRAWRLFTWRLRKRGLLRNYYAVREWNERHTCEHLHVVFQTRNELECSAIRLQWLLALRCVDKQLNADFVWTKHEWARDRGQMGAYLAKYLTKGLPEGLHARMYWYSLTWVFPGFARWAKGLWSLGVQRAERLAWMVRIGSERPETQIFKRLLDGSHWLDKSTGELIQARSIKAVECALEPYKLWERTVKNGSCVG